MNYARIIDNVAVDVSADPSNQFHPIIAAEFVQVPDDVVVGSKRNGDKWEHPEPQPEPMPEVDTVVYPSVSPVEFKLLFTSEERIAIKAARETDPVLDDFFDIVEDPRLTQVNLNLKSTQDAIQYLVAKELITAERADEILTGELV